MDYYQMTHKNGKMKNFKKVVKMKRTIFAQYRRKKTRVAGIFLTLFLALE